MIITSMVCIIDYKLIIHLRGMLISGSSSARAFAKIDSQVVISILLLEAQAI